MPERIINLCERHVRGVGDESLQCCICLSRLQIRAPLFPVWTQCPRCKAVMHGKCFRGHAKRRDDGDIRCPHCNHTYPSSLNDEWNADDLVATCMEEDDDSHSWSTGSVACDDVPWQLRSHCIAAMHVPADGGKLLRSGRVL